MKQIKTQAYAQKTAQTQNSAQEPKNPEIIGYHGTNSPQFDRFQKTLDIGYHFGNYNQARWKVPQEGSANPRIIQSRLKLKNPIEMPDHTWTLPDSMVTWLNQHGLTDPRLKPLQDRYNSIPAELKHLLDTATNTQLYRQQAKALRDERRQAKDEVMAIARGLLQAQGHDGVIYDNKVEGEGKSYIVFNPDDIEILNHDYKP